uniref:Uncharacterized protein n=1 Tax=Tetraselmis sp. GSL018 TaxID=582737 RepID=A0A061QJE8_9CHLO
MSEANLSVLQHAAPSGPKGEEKESSPGPQTSAASSAESGNMDAISEELLDNIINSDLRRCYSETHLVCFDSLDMKAALEALQMDVGLDSSIDSMCLDLYD